jgi:hypothetical protein
MRETRTARRGGSLKKIRKTMGIHKVNAKLDTAEPLRA